MKPFDRHFDPRAAGALASGITTSGSGASIGAHLGRVRQSPGWRAGASAGEGKHGAGDRIGVMHLVDTLDAGGAERMAVNLVNALPRDRYRPYLCTTRRDGALGPLVAGDVTRVGLERRHRFDVAAYRRLVAFNAAENIRVLHAHGAAVFIAVAASLRPPHPKVCWHDHYGAHGVQERPGWLYRPVVSRCAGVVAVSEVLAAWSRDRLGVPVDRICYLPNFVEVPDEPVAVPDLPGRSGVRIICAANLRPQKDHETLLLAMSRVRRAVPDAHLLLAGRAPDDGALERVRAVIGRERLEGHVTVLGSRPDLPAVLRGCDVGVLSSVSEGLPLSLLEYGVAGLPVVATDVGQVADVLDNGRAGLLVPPGDSARLADALVGLLRSRERRVHFGAQLRLRVTTRFSAAAAVTRLERLYDRALAPSPATAAAAG
jgi:glycosyltransferase involved in cell wall biosynthesis